MNSWTGRAVAWRTRTAVALPSLNQLAPWLALPCAAIPLQGHAGYGSYLHDYGIASGGMGGIGFALAQDTTPLSANPALALLLGKRYDLGVQLDHAIPDVFISGNAAGPDQHYGSERRNFFTPQAGFSLPLSERVAVGMTGFFAGVGADYAHSPFQRFGGPPQTSLALAQAGVSSALAFAPVPTQQLGLSLNLSYQQIEAKGLQSFAAASEAPDHFTDQGADTAFGVGFTLGWHGQLASNLEAGASYRSKTWTQRFQNYAGLLPGHGRLEFPATFGAGLALTPIPDWTVAIEFQRVMYGAEAATGNRSDQVPSQPLGADDGPGFGWRNQTIYKFGLRYQPSKTLTLRAGYSAAAALIPPSQTLFGALSPSVIRRHYTAGATAALASNWELTGMLAYGPVAAVHGEQSIPAAAGGGEADNSLRALIAGVAISRRFGP